MCDTRPYVDTKTKPSNTMQPATPKIHPFRSVARCAAVQAAATAWRRCAGLATLALGLGGLASPALADYPTTVLGYGPVGYWRLNETAASVEDSTAHNTGTGGAALNGAYVNYPTKGVAGAIVGDANPGVSFSNIAPKRKMLIPYSPALNPAGSFSAEIWVNPTSVTNGLQTVFCSGQFASSGRSGWLIYQNNTTWNLRMYTGTGTATSVNVSFGAAAVGVWSHLVVVFDAVANTATLYVDGVGSPAATPSPAFVPGASGGTAVAGRADVADFDNACSADEMAIYPTALSATEVAAHHANGLDAGRTTPYQTLVASSNPVGYYRLDEAVFVPPVAANLGTAGALAAGAYGTGTATNVAGPPSMPGLGAANVACGFNGTGQINCGNDTALDVAEISVVAWIKPAGVFADMSVVAKGSALWNLQIDGSTNHLKWVYADTVNGSASITGAINVTNGLWHHVVAVAGASGAALYVDGVLDASNLTSVSLPTTADPVTIGSQNTASPRWNGSLDEVALIPAALDEAQAVALYLAAEPPTKDIYSFGPGAVIAGTNITWTLPMGTDVTTLAPTFTCSFQATCDKVSGAPQDFTHPVTYSITGFGDPIPKVYSVTVILANVPVLNGIACWYDAGQGITTDATGVLTWDDQSGNGHLATRLSGAPTLAPNDINSRNGVHFRSNTGILDCAGPMFVKEQYVVVRSPNPAWAGSLSFLGRKSADFLSVRSSSYNIANGTTGFWQDHYPITVVKNGHAPAPYPAVVNSGVNQDKNGTFSNGCSFALDDITQYMILKIVVDASATAANLAQYPYYQIGQNETLGSGEFDVAEIIGYGTTLSAADEQVVGTYLSNKYGLSTAYNTITYATWAAQYASGGAANDDANRDGVQNGIAYFMGANGSTTNPGVVNNTVSWKKSAAAVAGYGVNVSTDLQTWTDAPLGSVAEVGGFVVFTLPHDGPALFVRLEVTIP